MKNNKKKIITVIAVALVIITLEISLAMFSYMRTGSKNSQLIVGDIYMKYTETTTNINISDMLPTSTKPVNDYFEFTVEGTNTTTDKDIIYDINIAYGDAVSGKTRIRDEFLRFTLEVDKTGSGTFTPVIENKSYSDFSSGLRMYVDKILKNTTTKVTHTYRLYVWIDDSIRIYGGDLTSADGDYSVDEWNNLFASVKVNVTGDFENKKYVGQPIQIGDKLSEAILEHITEDNSDTDSDNVTYISGCGDEEEIDGTTCTEANKIDFNFVWYSGKLWRVVAIYPDGEMKLVTENPITAMYWGADETYSTSWVREWLNQDFKDTLVNQDKVLISNDNNFYWNAKMTTATTKQAKETATAFTDTVGMLYAYEYTESYKKASNTYGKGYLNIKQFWWLITPYSSSNVHSLRNDGYLRNDSPLSKDNAVRPSIYLKSSITFAGGDGTRNNPYKIGEDISAPTTNTKISSRASGEYVMFKNELFRIVGKEGETTKIVKADYMLNGRSVLYKCFSTGITYGSGTGDDYWDYYLNNTWLTATDKAMLDQGTYYLGEYEDGVSYKKTLCATTNDNTNYTKTTKECDKITSTYTGYAGLLRVGEMFSSQLKTSQSSYRFMWLITPYSSSRVRYVGYDGSLNGYSPSSDAYVVRPSVNLKSNIIITDGDGTEQDPFEIALGS